MTTMILTPFGSVRARFYDLKNDDSFLPGVSASLADKLDFLAARLREFQLEPALVWNAYDLVALQHGLEDDERYHLVLLILVLRIQQNYGSTCVALDSDVIPRELNQLLVGEDGAALHQNIQRLLHSDRLSMLVGVPDDYKPLILDDQNYLYIEQVYGAETELISRLAAFCTPPQTPTDSAVIEASIAKILASSPYEEIGLRQLHALRTCLDNPLVLISGGPGTGKTTLVFSVLRMLVQNGVSPEDIALAAPTGKAANRMGESLKNSFNQLKSDSDGNKPADAKLLEPIFESARTIHRLLGYSPARELFMRNANNPLDAQVVIIDEASMLDLSLMLAVLRALKPGARLILLGDAHQLPSVDAGAIFRDLIPDENTPRSGVSATQLTENHRVQVGAHGAQIVALARAINSGEVGEIAFRPALDQLQYLGTERIDFLAAGNNDQLYTYLLDKFLAGWFARHYELPTALESIVLDDQGQPLEIYGSEIQKLFAHYNQARVLCLTKKRATGTDAINRKMHALYRQKSKSGTGALLAGEPVMMLKNDYTLEVFNGDQGVIVAVRVSPEKTSRYVAFPTADPEKFRLIPLGKIARNLELSYAMTIHKSQGSEYAHIALMLPTETIPLLTREILYTGVTRASKSVTVVGSLEMLQAGAGNPTERVTGLRRR